MNCYSFGSHLLSWQISANFRFSLKADLHLSDLVRFVPEADMTNVGQRDESNKLAKHPALQINDCI